MAYFKEYPYITEKLDQSYDLFISKMKEVITLVDQLFATQIHPQYGVYPDDITEWLEANPKYKLNALCVTRIENDNAKEIPYNVYYAKANERINKFLEEAKEAVEKINDTTLNKTWWKEYITTLQNGFVHNKWEEAEIFFLTLPADSRLLLTLGPIDTYHDKITGTKQFYSGWLLIRNSAQENIDILLRDVKNINSKNSQNVTFFIGDLLFAGGEVAKHNTMGWSRPGKTELFKKYGTIKAIAYNKLPIHTMRMGMAIEKSLEHWVMSKELAEKVKQFHDNDSMIPLVLHEYSHTVDKNPLAQAHLGAYYTDIEETRANTMMLRLANLLTNKELLPKNSVQLMFLRVLLYLPYLYEEYSIRQQREAYYFAGLYWLQKAEALGIISVGEKITLHESVLDKKIEKLTFEITQTIENYARRESSDEILAKQKKELFLFGADLAIRFAW